MKRLPTLLLTAALAMTVAPLRAQPYAGLEASATRLSDPSWRGRGVGVIGGWVLSDTWATELGVRRLGSDLVVNQPTSGSLWEVSLLGRMNLSGGLNAYARLGASQVSGALADSHPKAGRVKPLLGLGLHALVTENWALRAEVQRVGSGLVGLRLGLVRRF